MLFVSFEWQSNEYSFGWQCTPSRVKGLKLLDHTAWCSIRKLFCFHSKWVCRFDSTWEHKIQSNLATAPKGWPTESIGALPVVIVSLLMNILLFLNENSISCVFLVWSALVQTRNFITEIFDWNHWIPVQELRLPDTYAEKGQNTNNSHKNSTTINIHFELSALSFRVSPEQKHFTDCNNEL